MTAEWYRKEVLDITVRLYAPEFGPSFILMANNAHPHTSVLPENYPGSEGVARIEWPAYTPYLNSTEILWNALGRAVCARFPTPATVTDVQTPIQEERRLRRWILSWKA